MFEVTGDPASKRLPRPPVQQRGKERVALILAAADAMVRESGVEAITAHAVAERSGVPPASVYQFFPTPEAILYALAQSYIAQVQPVFDATMEAAQIERWQDLIHAANRVASRFFDAYPQAAEIIMGSFRTREIYASDKSLNENMARRLRQTFEKHFVMPAVPDLDFKFVVMVELADAVWGISLRNHGRLTEEMMAESAKAMISYLANYLPETLPGRTELPPPSDPARPDPDHA